VLEHLRGLGVTGRASFRGDDAGWTALEIEAADGVPPLLLQCYLSSEPGIRAELNSWAAWLETCQDNSHHAALMERVIQTKQLYTLQGQDRICESLCRHLAALTDGVWQADGAGFFDRDGTLLLKES